MAKQLMEVVNDALQFGDVSLDAKAKLDGFEWNGNVYKVKTFKELTKLERDEMFLYESEPGTEVTDFVQTESGLIFRVCGVEDANITVGLKEDTEYEVFENGKSVGKMKSNLGGKLSFSVEFTGEPIEIKITE